MTKLVTCNVTPNRVYIINPRHTFQDGFYADILWCSEEFQAKFGFFSYDSWKMRDLTYTDIEEHFADLL